MEKQEKLWRDDFFSDGGVLCGSEFYLSRLAATAPSRREPFGRFICCNPEQAAERQTSSGIDRGSLQEEAGSGRRPLTEGEREGIDPGKQKGARAGSHLLRGKLEFI